MQINHRLTKFVLVLFMVFSMNNSCTAADTAALILSGSTPGDSQVKTMLAIPKQTKVDFIKWNVSFNSTNGFIMDIVFGESQPNTLGFIAGGKKRSIKGTYSVTNSYKNRNFKQVYILSSAEWPGEIPIVRLNQQIFHLLTPEGELMNGNGGWSYSLNRKAVSAPDDELFIKSSVTDDSWTQAIFDGRTPCREIADEHPEMRVSEACFKLKWRLILNRDPKTLVPTTYSIRKVVDGKVGEIFGKWTIQQPDYRKPDQLIYTIEPGKPSESISFLAVDNNILLFLNKKQQPYTGNADFSFALNRKSYQYLHFKITIKLQWAYTFIDACTAQEN